MSKTEHAYIVAENTFGTQIEVAKDAVFEVAEAQALPAKEVGYERPDYKKDYKIKVNLNHVYQSDSISTHKSMWADPEIKLADEGYHLVAEIKFNGKTTRSSLDPCASVYDMEACSDYIEQHLRDELGCSQIQAERARSVLMCAWYDNLRKSVGSKPDPEANRRWLMDISESRLTPDTIAAVTASYTQEIPDTPTPTCCGAKMAWNCYDKRWDCIKCGFEE